MGAKHAKNGSEAEPKEVEHGGRGYSRSDFDLIDFKGGRNCDEAHTLGTTKEPPSGAPQKSRCDSAHRLRIVIGIC